MIDIVVRLATLADHAAIRQIETDAFAGTGEADLVEALRASDSVVLELVAVAGGRAVGHVLFSRLLVENGGAPFPAVALAPLAVAGAMQRKGVGTALVAEAHRLLKPRENLSVVLGEPGYYGRFGYEHTRAAGFSSAYQCEALQALAWSEEAPFAGRLVYAAPSAGL